MIVVVITLVVSAVRAATAGMVTAVTVIIETGIVRSLLAIATLVIEAIITGATAEIATEIGQEAHPDDEVLRITTGQMAIEALPDEVAIEVAIIAVLHVTVTVTTRTRARTIADPQDAVEDAASVAQATEAVADFRFISFFYQAFTNAMKLVHILLFF